MGRRKENKQAEKTAVRIGTVNAIPAVLRELGVDPTEVIEGAGVDTVLFDDPDNIISYIKRSHLIDHCVTKTGCQHFGLLVGQRAGIESLGLVGLLAKYSPNVETALCNLVSAMHLHVRGARVDFTVDTHAAMLSYDIYEANTIATAQVGDGALAIMYNLIRSFCGATWRPVEIWFAHRKPDDIRPYRNFFRAPLLFDQTHNAIVFSKYWLRQEIPGADAALERLLQKQINSLEFRHREGFLEQVRNVLRAGLVTGHYNADDIAALFSMHSRTLSRRLEAYGTTFRILLDEGRYEIARQMLQDTDLPVSEIASALDYADASAFTRAFRRWSDTTPAVWRERNNR